MQPHSHCERKDLASFNNVDRGWNEQAADLEAMNPATRVHHIGNSLP